MLDFTNRKIVIFGIQGSGKSHLVKKVILPKITRGIVFDTLDEYQDFPRYVPKSRNKDGIPELEAFIPYAVKNKYSMIIVDEANRYMIPQTPLPEQVSYINDFQLHIPIALLCIARRPVQLNTNITELAHYIICFNLAGKNDISYLNDLTDGLGDSVAQLEAHEFIICGLPRKNYQKFAPVPE